MSVKKRHLDVAKSCLHVTGLTKVASRCTYVQVNGGDSPRGPVAPLSWGLGWGLRTTLLTVF